MADVAAKARNQWKNVGTMLDIDASVLHSFGAQYNADPMDCFRAIFSQWKTNCNTSCPPFTWLTIIEVLESDVVQRRDLAFELRRKYLRNA